MRNSIFKDNHAVESREPPADFDSTDEKRSKSKEGWEACLRRQISNNPRIAIGTGLLIGILTGWWAKR